MSRQVRLSPLYLVAGFLILALSSIWTTSSFPASIPHQDVPPNPRLIDRIRRGEVKLPQSLTVPPSLLSVEQRKGIPQGLTGAVNVLVALVDFNDNAHTVTPTFFDSLFFAPPVSGRGSVRDYYSEVSYGKVDIVTLNLPSGLAWIRASSNYSYYVNGNYCEGAYPQNCEKLAEEIIDILHLAGVDFSKYDNNHDGFAEPVIIVHAGPGAEFTGNPNDVWSHSSVLPNPRSYDGVTIRNYSIVPEYWETVSSSTSDMTIGVIAHEMGLSFWSVRLV